MSFLRSRIKSLVENLKVNVQRIKVEGYSLAYASQHPGTPWYAKLSIIITLGYLLSPIDLIPDFIPVLGYLDDLLLVPLLILISVKLIPNEILEECREKASKTKEKSKKTAWWFAVLVVLFYAISIYFIIKYLKHR